MQACQKTIRHSNNKRDRDTDGNDLTHLHFEDQNSYLEKLGTISLLNKEYRVLSWLHNNWKCCDSWLCRATTAFILPPSYKLTAPLCRLLREQRFTDTHLITAFTHIVVVFFGLKHTNNMVSKLLLIPNCYIESFERFNTTQMAPWVSTESRKIVKRQKILHTSKKRLHFCHCFTMKHFIGCRHPVLKQCPHYSVGK